MTWAVTNRSTSTAHLTDHNFPYTYEALCGASVYQISEENIPAKECRKCRIEATRREVEA